jgi:uncharacterized protein YggE
VKRFTAISSLLLLALLTLTNSANASDMEATVSVTGEGVVTAIPDMAMVSTGVTTEAATPEAALNANTAAMNGLMKVLDDLDIAAKDRQTSNFNVSPQYRRERNDPGSPKIDGYRVSNQLTIRVRDLGELGGLLDALVKAGSNQLGNIRFDFADRGKLVDKARQLAVADARKRAELYVDAADVDLGDVLSISESGVAAPRPPMMRNAMMAESAADVPIAVGESEIRASVHMVFELE